MPRALSPGKTGLINMSAEIAAGVSRTRQKSVFRMAIP